ncbi:IS4 family transposase [Comamonas sp. JUb58]|uniref:IS4 family transposase n=1 Tax=Comamonas sp. JUb58 TaxID=2485114 RepID=UPI001060CCF8|nr:IS4 family transposase [Comamonas sp. JUb58]TDS75285.1 transposase Tn5 family protein [Comamonas sp. JUb58]
MVGIAYILNNKPARKQMPKVRSIAQLGGLLDRKGEGDSRVETPWLRLRDTAVFVHGIRASRKL